MDVLLVYNICFSINTLLISRTFVHKGFRYIQMSHNKYINNVLTNCGFYNFKQYFTAVFMMLMCKECFKIGTVAMEISETIWLFSLYKVIAYTMTYAFLDYFWWYENCKSKRWNFLRVIRRREMSITCNVIICIINKQLFCVCFHRFLFCVVNFITNRITIYRIFDWKYVLE